MADRQSLIRFLILAVLVSALGGAAIMSSALGLDGLDGLVAVARPVGAAGPLIGVFGSALLVAAMVPRTAVAALAGVLFGPITGAAYVLVGACIGAVAAFGAGRWLGRDYLMSRRRTANVARWVGDRGVVGVVALRLLPLAPFGLVSYALGATAIPLRSYAAGTALGILPGTVIYAGLGASFMWADAPGLVVTVAAAVCLCLATSVAAFRVRRSRNW